MHHFLKYAKKSLEETRIENVALGPSNLTFPPKLYHVSIKHSSLFNWDAIGENPTYEEREAESYDQVCAQWLDLGEYTPSTLETLTIQLYQSYRPRDRHPRHRIAAFRAMLEDFVRSKDQRTRQLDGFRPLCVTALSRDVNAEDGPGSGDWNLLLTPLRDACAESNVEPH